VAPHLRFKLNALFVTPFSSFARFVVGINMVILNPERGRIHRPSIMIGNHQTGLDFALISQACPPGYVIVGKKEIRNIPIFGWFFWIAGNLLINRSDKAGSKTAIDEVKDRLEKHHLNLAIFPEGTRSKSGTLLPFKKGAFYLGVRSGFPLVPVVCSRLQGKAIWENRELKGGNVVISILEPIETRQIPPEELPVFMEEVRRRMVEEYDRVNAIAAEMDLKDGTC
jgi:1-acyl-sn-glycerol-3-phosphate acyltransferase